MPDFTATDIRDLSGTTAIVTGASDGIGLETARALAEAGARVVYAVRNTTKGRQAAGPAAEVRHLDLASLDSVRRFAEEWDGEIDLLICNAGIVLPPKLTTTVDGFEVQFGVNHLGHFALANLLLPHVTGRVVSLSANAARFGKIDFDDLNWEHKKYNRNRAYAQSKLATLLFTVELQRRLAAAGSTVRAVAAHPGAATTNALKNSGGSDGPLVRAMRRFSQTPAQAALETLYAATADIPGGSYVGPGGRMQISGPPKLVKLPKSAQDPALAERLWEASAKLTNVSGAERSPRASNPS
jgi:NAD(P)-dependent dehydrogenase (short-subunit alcohol dehydrogenase family)